MKVKLKLNKSTLIHLSHPDQIKAGCPTLPKYCGTLPDPPAPLSEGWECQSQNPQCMSCAIC
jgi:hypothetical protein